MEKHRCRRRCPTGIGYEWTELTYQQILAGNTALFIFPLCVLLVVPRARGAVRELDAAARHHPHRADVPALRDRRRVAHASGDNNVFTQIGFVVLVGLACKNAILIVEFAREAQMQGAHRRRGGARGLPSPAAPDPHDVVRLHPRRGAAGHLAAAPAPKCATRWAPPCSPACSASRSSASSSRRCST